MRAHGYGGGNLGRVYQHGTDALYFLSAYRVYWELFIDGVQTQAQQTSNDLGSAFPTAWFTFVLTFASNTMSLYCFNATTNLLDTASNTGTPDTHGGDLCIGNRLSDTARNADADFGGATIIPQVFTSDNVATLRTLLYGV